MLGRSVPEPNRKTPSSGDGYQEAGRDLFGSAPRRALNPGITAAGKITVYLNA